MAIKIKDSADLKAKAKAKFDNLVKSGLDSALAFNTVKEYLDDNEFQNDEGHCVKLSLDSMDVLTDTDPTDNKSIAKEIGDAIRDSLKSLTVETKGGKVSADVVVRTEAEKLVENDETKRNWGFKNMADFGRAIMHLKGATGITKTDHRLKLLSDYSNGVRNGQIKATPTSFASELVGADGGFAVPPEYKDTIWTAVQDQESILSMTDLQTTASNVVNLVADENTPWDNSTGIAVYSRAQGATMSQSKPVIQNRQIQLNEIYALVPVSNELLEDGPMLNDLLTNKAAAKIGYKIDEYIFRGKGNGEPLGFLNANSLVTQAKYPGQAANTFALQNITDMSTRILAPNMRNPGAVWIMTRRAYAAIPSLTIGTPGSAGGFPVGTTTIDNQIIPSLLGMPVYVSEHASAFSSAGDVILCNLKGYAAYTKASGLDFQTSIHLFFDSNTTAFRWVFRMGGEPYLRSAVTPANDTTITRSHFVALGAR